MVSSKLSADSNNVTYAAISTQVLTHIDVIGFESLAQVLDERIHVPILLQKDEVLHAYVVASVQRALRSLMRCHCRGDVLDPLVALLSRLFAVDSIE